MMMISTPDNEFFEISSLAPLSFNQQCTLSLLYAKPMLYHCTVAFPNTNQNIILQYAKLPSTSWLDWRAVWCNNVGYGSWLILETRRDKNDEDVFGPFLLAFSLSCRVPNLGPLALNEDMLPLNWPLNWLPLKQGFPDSKLLPPKEPQKPARGTMKSSAVILFNVYDPCPNEELGTSS